MSDSLQPHESQHPRPPCPSPTPGVHSNSHPLSQWCHPAISSSVVPFSPSPPAPNPAQHQSLFQWVNSSQEVAKVLEFQHHLYILIVYFLLSDNNETSYEKIPTEGKRDKYQVNLKCQWIWVGTINQLLGLAQLIYVSFRIPPSLKGIWLFSVNFLSENEILHLNCRVSALLNGMLPVSTLSPLALSLPSFLGHTLPLPPILYEDI